MNGGIFIRFRADGMAILKPGLAFDSVFKLVGEEKKPKVGGHARGSWKVQWAWQKNALKATGKKRKALKG